MQNNNNEQLKDIENKTFECIKAETKQSLKETMNKRSLFYEKQFRTYLFSFDFETHKAICKNINVKAIEGGF